MEARESENLSLALRTLSSEISLKEKNYAKDSLLPIYNEVLVVFVDVEENWRNWQAAEKRVNQERGLTNARAWFRRLH